MSDQLISNQFDASLLPFNGRWVVPNDPSNTWSLTVSPPVQPVVIGQKNSLFSWIDAATIQVDEDYQRGLNDKRVLAIASDLDHDVFNVITVSKRADGTVHCLDGQHRVGAAIKANPDVQVMVPCIVYTGLSPQDEARIFYKMNRHRLTPSAYDGFKARLAYGDETATAVQTIADQFGLRIVNGYNKSAADFSQVVAIAELESLYEEGLLIDVLSIINDAWQELPQAHKGIYMRGLGTFLRVFAEELSDPRTGTRRRERLINTLATLGTDGLEKNIAFYKQNIGSNPRTAIARAIHFHFNKGLGAANGTRLPVWGIGGMPETGD